MGEEENENGTSAKDSEFMNNFKSAMSSKWNESENILNTLQGRSTTSPFNDENNITRTLILEEGYDKQGMDISEERQDDGNLKSFLQD